MKTECEIIDRVFEIANSFNFDLILEHRICLIFDTEYGEREKFLYQIGINVRTRNGGTLYFSATVDSDKVKGTDWLRKATHSLAILPKGKDEQAEYAHKVQCCIESENAELEFIYPNSGWRNVPGIGWRFVYSGGAIGSENVLVHTATSRYSLDVMEETVGTAEIFHKAMAMTSICRNGMTSLALFLFVHASLMGSIFNEIGHPINFVFSIVGVTNSRKTSLVLAMAKLFDRQNMVADAEFATATACGIEKTLGIYKDGVVIIDDFKPGVTASQQKKMDEKLDELVRLYGNHVTKKRMLEFSADADKKFFPICGGCVLTMEIVTGVLSSMTRMFITEIGGKEVDNEKLGFYQREKQLLPTHIYDFILWMTGRLTKVKEYLLQQFPVHRDRGNFSVPRHNEMYATFMTTANILARYAFERNFWGDMQCQEFLADVQKKMTLALNDLGIKIRGKDKGIMMMQALIEALKSSKLNPVQLNAETAARKSDIYEDSIYLYIRSRELRRITNVYARFYGIRITIIDEDEVLGLLERLGLIEIYENGTKRERSRKLPIQKENHLRYLWIKKEALWQYEQSCV